MIKWRETFTLLQRGGVGLRATVPVNKKFTFDDCRTIDLRCERLRFVPDETVQERK